MLYWKQIIRSTEQLADLGRQVVQMHRIAVEVWEVAMRTIPTDTSEYRAVCAMGERVQDVYYMLRAKAEEQSWTQEQITQVFGLDTGSTFI